MVSCIIVDDEDVAREGMKLLVRQFEFIELKGTFSSAIEADLFLKTQRVDILFLDIKMPKLSGMEYLRLKQNNALVIFTTAYIDQAFNAFENGAVDYLLKPIRIERFYKALARAIDLIESKKHFSNEFTESSVDSSYFFIKHDRKVVRLNYSDILFIEGLKDYCLIQTKDKRLDAPMNLRTIEKQLPSRIFARVSKSHIINSSYISHIETDLIQLLNFSITLSPLYKNEFYERFVNDRYFKREK